MWMCQPLLEKELVAFIRLKNLTVGGHLSCEGLSHAEKSKVHHFSHHTSCRSCMHDLLCLAGTRWGVSDWEGGKGNHSPSPGIALCWVGWWERQGSGKAGLGSEESGTWLVLQILGIYPQITNLILGFVCLLVESQRMNYILVVYIHLTFDVPGHHQAFEHS